MDRARIMAPRFRSSRGLRRVCVALLGLAGMLAQPGAQPASAQALAPEKRASPKIVVLGGHPTLERALRLSLAPWSMLVDVVMAPSPGSSMPITALRARVLAEQLHADALVWISLSPDGAALWVHDGRTGNVTARSTPAPPFDVPTAAALALSVKTILRASGFAPAAEAPAPAASSAAPGGEEPAWRDRERASDAPRLPPEAPARAERPEPSPPRDIARLTLPEPQWQLLVHGAVRVGAFRPSESGARYGLQLRFFPWAASASAWRGGWFGLDLETSTPWVVSRAEFYGEYWDVAPGLCTGIMHRFARVLELGLQVRGSLHLISLSGTLTDDSSRASIWSRSASLLVRPELGVAVGNVTLLLQPGAGVFFERQAYEDLGVEVLRTRPLWWMLGAAIALRAD